MKEYQFYIILMGGILGAIASFVTPFRFDDVIALIALFVMLFLCGQQIIKLYFEQPIDYEEDDEYDKFKKKWLE